MKTWPVLIALLTLLILWWQAGHDPEKNASVSHAAPARPLVSQPTAESPPSLTEVAPPPAGITGEDLPRARVYRLLADGEQFSLQAVDEVQGDFRQPRAQPAGSGVLSCRLVSDKSGLLASTLVAAPVIHCNVLDPVTGGAVTYVRPAPQVMQIRLPRVEGADRLEIHADASTTEPASPSRLLASIPLDAK
ncbi:MAG: hypothetical protein V4675_13835 [Verrucomicrobiota bacterium]